MILFMLLLQYARLSPSLKVQSWLRMEPNASSFDSVASSATLRSTYTIICFSCTTKTRFSDNSRNPNTDRSQKYPLVLSMSQTRGMWCCFSGTQVPGWADIHFDLWVCFISWICSLLSTADVSEYTLLLGVFLLQYHSAGTFYLNKQPIEKKHVWDKSIILNIF